MSKIQEFIDAFESKVNLIISENKEDIIKYNDTREVVILLQTPFVIKVPSIENDKIDIPSLDATTIGQVFDWTFPEYGEEEISDLIYINRIDTLLNFGNGISDSDSYISGYTYGDIQLLGENIKNILKTSEHYNILRNKASSLWKIDHINRLKRMGGQEWFNNWMRATYQTLSKKILVSKLSFNDYNNISNNIDSTLLESYIRGSYYSIITTSQVLYDAMIEAGDEYFLNSNTSNIDGEYIISVKGTSEYNISGKISFYKSGGDFIPKSSISGLPNPWTNSLTNRVVENNNGIINYTGNQSTNKKDMADDAISTLESMISQKYGLGITLQYTEGVDTIEDDIQNIPTPSDVTSPKTGEFTFNVEELNIFNNSDIGSLSLTGKMDTTFIYGDIITYEPTDDEYFEADFDGSEEVEFEIARQMEIRDELQTNSLDDVNPDPTSLKQFDNVDFNSTAFVGSGWKKFNIDDIINKINNTKYGVSGKFKESLKTTLYYIKNDSLIDDIRKASYLLATAFVESGYSLQRWEADFACQGQGIPYVGSPCTKAIDYFRSSKKKKNYFLLGTDSKGLPYFGRGLIQLTGKDNYAAYGKKIGIDLVGNGDAALLPQNSYKIAVQYMKSRTFKHVMAGEWYNARRSVNGNGNDKQGEVNGGYNTWNKIFVDTHNATIKTSAVV